MNKKVILLILLFTLTIFSACNANEVAKTNTTERSTRSEEIIESTTSEVLTTSELSEREKENTAIAELTSVEITTDKEDGESMSRQSKLMLDYTGKKWSKQLEEALKDVDFTSFAFDIDNPVYISDVDSLFVLANKANRFPNDFKPKNLITPKSKHAGSPSRRQLREPAANAMDDLISAAKADSVEIQTVSAYRSISYQRGLFKAYAKRHSEEEANQFSARAGHSEHHTGLCVDVSSPSVGYGLDYSYGNTKEGKWIEDNSYKYGYVVRYPRDKNILTGYRYEPWHLRYFGVPLATYLHETDLSYEEFIALQVGKMPEEITIEWIDFDK